MRTKRIIKKQLRSEIRPHSHFDSATRNMANQGEANSVPVAPDIAAIIRETVQQCREQTVEEASQIAVEAANRVLESQATNLRKIKDDLQKKRKCESISLKKQSNSDQYSHGLEVLDNLEEAVDALENEDIDKAKKLLNEGKDIVNKRLKLVQLADREDWLVVNEFDQTN